VCTGYLRVRSTIHLQGAYGSTCHALLSVAIYDTPFRKAGCALFMRSIAAGAEREPITVAHVIARNLEGLSFGSTKRQRTTATQCRFRVSESSSAIGLDFAAGNYPGEGREFRCTPFDPNLCR
jgi:hypothetical protein